MEQNKDQIGAAVRALPSDLTEREQIDLLCQVETYMTITEKHSQTHPAAQAEETRIYSLVNGFIAKRFSDIGAAVRGESVVLTDYEMDAVMAEWVRTSNSCITLCRMIEAAVLRKLSARAADAPSDLLGTDLSHRLRETADKQPGWKPLLDAAAEEIERYYGGMLAWKKTAEKKDADYNNERMERVNDRIKSRAADAPSEPSKVPMLRQALVDLHHAIQFAHDSLGGGIHKMPTMLHQLGTVTEFIENVLCSTAAHDLDCQPTNTAWKLVPSEPTEAMLRSAISYREVDANDEIEDPVLSILDRQYRAMLAAADALDSQPTYTVAPPVLDDASWRAGIQAFRSALNEMTGRDGYVVQETYKAIYASLSSQPTDGGVRK